MATMTECTLNDNVEENEFRDSGSDGPVAL